MLLVRMRSISVGLALFLSLILCQSPLAVAQTVPSHNHVILIALKTTVMKASSATQPICLISTRLSTNMVWRETFMPMSTAH